MPRQHPTQEKKFNCRKTVKSKYSGEKRKKNYGFLIFFFESIIGASRERRRKENRLRERIRRDNRKVTGMGRI